MRRWESSEIAPVEYIPDWEQRRYCKHSDISKTPYESRLGRQLERHHGRQGAYENQPCGQTLRDQDRKHRYQQKQRYPRLYWHNSSVSKCLSDWVSNGGGEIFSGGQGWSSG